MKTVLKDSKRYGTNTDLGRLKMIVNDTKSI